MVFVFDNEKSDHLFHCYKNYKLEATRLGKPKKDELEVLKLLFCTKYPDCTLAGSTLRRKVFEFREKPIDAIAKAAVGPAVLKPDFNATYSQAKLLLSERQRQAIFGSQRGGPPTLRQAFVELALKAHPLVTGDNIVYVFRKLNQPNMDVSPVRMFSCTVISVLYSVFVT